MRSMNCVIISPSGKITLLQLAKMWGSDDGQSVCMGLIFSLFSLLTLTF